MFRWLLSGYNRKINGACLGSCSSFNPALIAGMKFVDCTETDVLILVVYDVSCVLGNPVFSFSLFIFLTALSSSMQDNIIGFMQYHPSDLGFHWKCRQGYCYFS